MYGRTRNGAGAAYIFRFRRPNTEKEDDDKNKDEDRTNNTQPVFQFKKKYDLPDTWRAFNAGSLRACDPTSSSLDSDKSRSHWVRSPLGFRPLSGLAGPRVGSSTFILPGGDGR